MPPTQTDPRIGRARRALADGVKRAAEAQSDPARNRSTATRAAYKAKAEACDTALAILNEKPANNGKKPEAASPAKAAAARSKRAVKDVAKKASGKK